MPAAKKKAVEPEPELKPKPRCKNPDCNHVFSFHKGGTSHCHVVGCHCAGWKGPRPKADGAKK